MPSYKSSEMAGLAEDFAELSAVLRNKLAGKTPAPSPEDDHAHVCGICSKRFKRTEHLKRHARSHEPGPYLPCDICDRSFLRSDSLRRHKKIHKRAREDECSELASVHEVVGKQSRPRLYNRACRQCAKARVRCDGSWPCERCTSSDMCCERVRKKRSTGPEHDSADYAASMTSDNTSDVSSRIEDNNACDSASEETASQMDAEGGSMGYSTPREEDNWSPVVGGQQPIGYRTASWPVTEYDLGLWPQPDAMAGTTHFNSMPVQQDPYYVSGMSAPPVFGNNLWGSPVEQVPVYSNGYWQPEMQAAKVASIPNMVDYNVVDGLQMQPPWANPATSFQQGYA